MTGLESLPGAAVAPSEPVTGKPALLLGRFLQNRTAVAGLLIFAALAIFSLTGGLLTSWDKDTADPLAIGAPPSASHLLGTSQAGFDLYAMVVEGTRVSLLIGVLVGLASTLMAAVYGCTMAYYGGKVDAVMLFILEAMIMLPALLVVAVVTGGANSLRENVPGWLLLAAVLLVFSWMGSARLVRAQSMSVVRRDYILAARYMGIPAHRIVRRHLIPNIASLLVLDATRGITAAILAEVAFSFIGIGIRLPDVSLGVLIGAATAQMQSFPWMFWAPLAVMLLLTGSLAMMNDGLRDALDPHSAPSRRRQRGAPRGERRQRKNEVPAGKTPAGNDHD